MQIELTDQEIKFISEALAFVQKDRERHCQNDTVIAHQRRRDFKALRLKIDSALAKAEYVPRARVAEAVENDSD